MNFEDIDILEILPQRTPFVFVDKLLDCDRDNALTSFTVRPDCVLVDDGKLDPAGMVENMAQSCASLTGYVCKYILGLPVRLGYLGSVKNMKIYRCPSVGETITTSVRRKDEIFGIMLAEIELRSGDELLAEASMKTAQTDKEAQV